MWLFGAERRIDGDLELVAPAARHIDDFLLACAHPQCWADPATHWTRDQLCGFVQRHPNGTFGHHAGDRWPGFHFWMRLMPVSRPIVPFAGTISLRLGTDDDLVRYWGHVGYGVFPPTRGQHYAERSCRLILPLAKQQGLHEVWLTTNPENIPSRRTCERLGATLVEIVDVPESHPLFRKGDRQKCRYRIAV